MSKIYKTNSQVVPIIYVGLYDSLLSPENLFCDDEENYREEEGLEETDFDYKKYRSDLGVSAAEIVNGHSTDLGDGYGIVSVTSDGIIDPPPSGFYNFETDTLHIDIEVDDDFVETACHNIEKWIDDGNEKVISYFNKNFVSYDGFHSYLPQTLRELANALREGCYFHTYDLLVGAYAALCYAHRGLFNDTSIDDGSYTQSIQEELYDKAYELCYCDYATLSPMRKEA